MDGQQTNKPLILSGIQPTGDLTIGNYLGALRQWVDLQDTHTCYYTLVDLHAITTRQDPQAFRQRCYAFIAQYLACGIDPEKSTLFIQSHVPAHSELAWILNCFAYMGELNRMTQFKDKSQKHAENINTGLFTYPVLMAADILLYQADLVPVGADQKQHLEMTRNLAERFNQHYNQSIFKVPEPFIPDQQAGGRVMSLGDPLKKMSKSDEDTSNYIGLLDEPKQLIKKIKRAVTDSNDHIAYDWDNKPGVSNLLTLYAAVCHCSIEQATAHFEGKMYGHLKLELADAVVSFLEPIQEKYHYLMDNPEHLNSVLKAGAERANQSATQTLRSVQDAVGFIAQ